MTEEQNEKRYKVPEEITHQFDVLMGLQALRDRYIMRMFGYKRARLLAIEAETANRKAWNAIHELYPELRNKKLQYNHGEMEVSERDK